MSKLNLDLLDDCEKGYIIGLFLGDGSFNRGQKEPRFFVRFTLDKKRDNDIALRLLQIFEKAEKRSSIFYWRSNIIAKVCSKELVEYIQKFVTYRKCFKEKSKKIFFHDENWSIDFKYGIIAGIIDSDGHVHEHLETEIKTVSKEIFDGLNALCNELKLIVSTRLNHASNGSFSKLVRYVIYISSNEMKRHCKSIPSAKIARHL